MDIAFEHVARPVIFRHQRVAVCDIATVRVIDPQGASVLVEKDDGSQQMLDLSRLADRHVRDGWVRTIRSAQGATADRVMAHLESFRANTVDAASAYVAISRARDGVALYTDSCVRLYEALGLRRRTQVGAIDGIMQPNQMNTRFVKYADIST
ncbi:hypothetical protein [Sphingomonas sp.]|uniref:hypothetical protein n=1 Tax=Sphingomonas sp. TaxID=28214 RepID=UPI001EBF0398|nr:hypothetical protein [Sphingomonas sp.]MBX3594152.1 hypothetical protein [Sphingomonas sp.]